MTYIIDEALLLKDLSEADSLDSAIQASDDIVEIYLQHFGVKGMRWGVRKKPEYSDREPGSGGGAGSSSAMPSGDKALLKKAGVSDLDPETLKSKYGPGSLSGSKDPKARRPLSPEEKEFLVNAVAVVGIGAALYFYGKHLEKQQWSAFSSSKQFAEAMQDYSKTAGSRAKGFSKKQIEELSTEGFDFPAGSIFKRLSTQMETEIRPGGFYACFQDSDVDRYKAILPVFWKSWGLRSDSGYVVDLKANVPIKAPSPRAAFDIFKDMLDERIPEDQYGFGVAAKVRELYHSPGPSDADSFARRVYAEFAQGLSNNDNVATQMYIQKLKASGFNAVIDQNDAGALADKPMRLLDGSLFSVAGHTPLTADGIEQARQLIGVLKHYFLLADATFIYTGAKAPLRTKPRLAPQERQRHAERY